MTKSIVILHGWGADSTRFDEMKAKFEGLSYNVYVPDLPGFGKEDAPSEVWGVSEYAHWVHLAIAEMGINSYALVGHSFGGQIAAAYASMYAGEVNELVLVAPALVRTAKSAKVLFIEKITKAGKAVFSLPVLNQFYGLAEKGLYRVVKGSSYYQVSGIMKEIMAKIVRQDVSEDLLKVNIPTLVLWGTSDADTPLLKAQELLAANKNVSVIPFEGRGHNFYRQEADEVVKYIDEFIKRNE